MNPDKIEHLLNKGEGRTVEFKQAKSHLPANLFETVCAFLNRDGGEIVLGISDDKSIEGVDKNSTEAIIKQIANIGNNPQLLFPTFLIHAQVIEYRNKSLIYMMVPISSQTHQYKGKIFD